MAGPSREGSQGAQSAVKISEAGDQGAEGGTSGEFTFSADPSLEDIRQLQAEFVAERGWGQFHQPRNLLLALVGEVGEVAELFQWRAEPEARAGLPGWAPGERAALEEELSDVLLYLVSLAQQCRVDLPRAALRKLDRNRARYPADRAHGSARKYTHYQAGPTDAQCRDGPTEACCPRTGRPGPDRRTQPPSGGQINPLAERWGVSPPNPTTSAPPSSRFPLFITPQLPNFYSNPHAPSLSTTPPSQAMPRLSPQERPEFVSFFLSNKNLPFVGRPISPAVSILGAPLSPHMRCCGPERRGVMPPKQTQGAVVQTQG